MEGWLKLLSRPPGTGSTGAGWAQEVLDFITCLFGVGLVSSSLMFPVWELPSNSTGTLKHITYLRELAN